MNNKTIDKLCSTECYKRFSVISNWNRVFSFQEEAGKRLGSSLFENISELSETDPELVSFLNCVSPI